MQERIRVEGIFTGAINFAMQQNHIPVIRGLVLHNDTSSNYADLELVIRAHPEFAAEYRLKIDTLPSGGRIGLDNVDLALFPEYLCALTEKVAGHLEILLLHGEAEIARENRPIELLAYDQWSGLSRMPELLAAFVTPNHPRISSLITAGGKLLAHWGGDPTFTAYQSQDPNRVRMQMAAIYGAIVREELQYVQAPASFEPVGQRIRTVGDMLGDKMANCLELTLLFAACLEAVGLNPLLVVLEGHAFVGCWLEDLCFPECIQDDVTLLEKRIAPGIHEIALLECTTMSAGNRIPFEEAEALAAGKLAGGGFQLVVDVKRTRGSGIRPISLLKTLPDGKVTFEKPRRIDVVGESAPKEVSVYAKLEEIDSPRPQTRMQIWERKLLDLSLRNPLLNFRGTRGAIQLLIKDLGQLEDAVASSREFSILEAPADLKSTLRDGKIYELETGSTLTHQLIHSEFQNGRIRTYLSGPEIAGRVLHLYRQARVSLEENGANTLYLALGMLRWYENGISERARYAPLVLIPVEIVRKSALKGYVLRVRDEEPMMNITLLELLRQDFGLTITGLDPLPTDDTGVDLGLVLNIIRQAIMDKPKWDVEELAFLGLFGFSQFIMWNDMRSRQQELTRNKNVASLMAGRLEWKPAGDFPKAEELDIRYSPADLAIPLSADSSQLAAICAAGEGKSFVLHGPPGTGKSQTIANIIANTLYQGKTVLFIAEKMAALSVVQKRLAALGLAPFCLEVHSNKAKKKDVLGQLDETLSLGRIKRPERYQDEAEHLQDMRRQLNSVVEAIHHRQAGGVSLYEAVTIHENFKDAAGTLTLPSDIVGRLTPESFSGWLAIMDKLAVTARECGGVVDHPLADFRNPRFSPSVIVTVTALWRDYRSLLQQLDLVTREFTDLLDFPYPQTKKQQQALADLCGVLMSGAIIPFGLYFYEDLMQLEPRIVEVCGAGANRDAMERKLLADFTPQLLSIDEQSILAQWNQVSSGWFLPRMLGQNKILKQLGAYCKNPAALTKESLPELLASVSYYKRNAAILEGSAQLFEELFGPAWNGGRPDFGQIQEVYRQTVALHSLIYAICGGGGQPKRDADKALAIVLKNPTAFRQAGAHLLRQYMASWAQIQPMEDKLRETMACDFSRFESDPGWNEAMRARTDAWLSNQIHLRDWCMYLGVRDQAEKVGIGQVADALESGALAVEDMPDTFRKTLFGMVAENIIAADPTLQMFSGSLLDADIKRFAELTDKFEQMTRQELAAVLSANIPQVSDEDSLASSSEIGILKKAIRSGGRGMSIRSLFDKIPHLLPKLCPCMLMSPISAAQYIDPSFPQFDLVVFDEASQLPTCEAVGAIARGKNLVVVGDPKQLPPTSFFARNRIDEEVVEQEDLESILDDCLAISMPEAHLLWHYRSRHESLIAFSNMRYYGNSLYTFPSPNDLISEVKFVPVQGSYDRSGTRQNEAEADAVVGEIITRLADPRLRDQSIGVVTFSAAQQNLIDDKLQAAFAQNPALDEHNSASHEPVFIKNLENVQGDERDVILFSVGYGPDKDGKVTLNFGPLNREGGWRRLNVAVSRARHRMMVFSTLSPEQLDLSKTSADGVAGLRAFLEYAKHGRPALPPRPDAAMPHTSAILDNIAAAVEAMGYQVRTNVGYSRFRVDIGIVHPNRKGEFLLGILCDGESYLRAGTARDRNILQGNVLASLGWNIHRMWTLDWLTSPEKETRKIENAIRLALIGTPERPKLITTAPVSIQNFERDHAAPVRSRAKPYEICRLEAVTLPQDDFYMPESDDFIRKQITQVLETEAPIKRGQLYKRIIAAWGLTRAGTRITQRLDTLSGSMGLTVTKTLEAEFLWAPGQEPQQYDCYRIAQKDEERRNLDEIPHQEIAMAIQEVAGTQVSLLIPDLIREVYRLLGFTRIGESMESVIRFAVSHAVQEQMVRELDGKIVSV